MNAISFASKRIIKKIPAKVLMKVFNANSQYQLNLLASREEIITHEVIREMVLPDLDVIGGEQRVIRIGNLPWSVKGGASIVRIPLRLTNGRAITSALSIESQLSNVDMEQSMIKSAIGVESTGTSNVQVIGPNIIAITDYQVGVDTHLRCVLANDSQLANLPVTSYIKFANLCVLAAKAICYTKLIGEIGDVGVNGGSTNESLRSIIDSYADSDTLYDEMLETKIKKMFKMNDPVTKERLAKLPMV